MIEPLRQIHIMRLTAIRSRAQIFELYPLDDHDVRIALDRAIEDSDRGLKSYHPIVTKML